MRKHALNEHKFDKINTEEKAYWLGFIMADGYIENESRLCFILQRKKDEYDLFLKLQCFLETDNYVEERTVYDKRGFVSESYCFRVTSKILCKRLKRLKVVAQKTGKECIPRGVPKRLYRHFIRGFFDGDGCICKSSNRDYLRFFIGSCSKKVIEQIRDYIQLKLSFHINILERHKYNKPFFYLESNSKYNTAKFCKLLYQRTKISLERKFKLAKTTFKICPPKQKCLDKNAKNCENSKDNSQPSS